MKQKKNKSKSRNKRLRNKKRFANKAETGYLRVEEHDNRYTHEEESKEQHRTARIGCVIAIIASYGAILGFVFKIVVHILNQWPNKDVIHWSIVIFLFLISSIGSILGFQLVRYVLIDLKRHNVLDEKHEEYSNKLDASYSVLVTDCKMYMYIILFLLFVISSIIVFSTKEYDIDKRMVKAVLIVGIVGLIGLAIKKRKYVWNCIKKYIKDVGIKCFKMLILALIFFAIAFVRLISTSSLLYVFFQEDGMVKICSTSNSELDSIYILIANKSGETLYERRVLKEDVWKATEDVYTIGIDGKWKIANLGAERQYWKYIFDLSEFEAIGEKYKINVTINHRRNKVEITNEFSLMNQGYVFCVDKIEEKY